MENQKYAYNWQPIRAFYVKRYALYNRNAHTKILDFRKKGKIMNDENIPHFTNSARFSYYIIQKSHISFPFVENTKAAEKNIPLKKIL